MTLLMEMVYNDWTPQMTISLLSIPFFIVLYILRKIFPFNIIWWFLMIILIWASLGFVKKEIKEWWNK